MPIQNSKEVVSPNISEILEQESADLWYENMMLLSKNKTNEQEIADLWYQLIMKG